ncbi:lytic transglycosylase domain-containing protein [Roseomonas sp. WA12]
MSVPFLSCMALVAQIYALPPRVLPSIHSVEGGRPGLIMTNTNGSEDYGVMQINSVWLPALVRYTGLDRAEVRKRLIDRPCFNIAAAGLILRTHLDASGGDLMRAVGNYHSHTPVLHQSYRARVVGAATRLFVSRQVVR